MSYSTDSIQRQQKQLKSDTLKMQHKLEAESERIKSMITDLRNSNVNLRDQVSKFSNVPINMIELEKLTKVQDKADALEIQLQYERMRRSELQHKHNQTRVTLNKSRKIRGGVNAVVENKQIIDRQVKTLESRLDQALQQFNDTLDQSRKLRAEIDDLSEEKVNFQRIYKNLTNDLHVKRKQLADKIERANMDYEEKDQLQQEIDARKAAIEDERKMCANSFDQLDKVLEQLKRSQDEKKRNHFRRMSLHNRQRLSQMLDVKYSKYKKPQSPRSPNASPTKNTLLISDRNEEKPPEEEVQDILAIIEDLGSVTGYQNMGQLYEQFNKIENSNLSTYIYLNNLNNEQEELQKEIDNLKETLEAEPEEAERLQKLKELEVQLNAMGLQQQNVNKDLARHKLVLLQVRESVTDIFNYIGGDKKTAIQKYGTYEITDLNLAGFLGLLEDRLNQLIYLKVAGVPKDLAITAGEEEEEFEELHAMEEHEEPPVQPKAVVEEAGPEQPAAATSEYEKPFQNYSSVEGSLVDQQNSEIALSTGFPLSPFKASTRLEPDANFPIEGNPFIGVGPSVARQEVTAAKIVRLVQLPTTNINHDGGDFDEEGMGGNDEVLSLEEMKAGIKLKIQKRIQREERARRRKKNPGH